MTHVGSSGGDNIIIIIFGASGDLAAKKVYPALWTLYKQSLLPASVRIVGYARSALTSGAIMGKMKQDGLVSENELNTFEQFSNQNYYVKGNYSTGECFINLHEKLRQIDPTANRLFYMALPPNLYNDTSVLIKEHCMTAEGWVRIIFEKPFGRDLSSSNELSAQLTSLFDESVIYRIDHYLGKETLRNMITLRFANRLFSSVWNKENIKNISFTLKENFGTEGRAGYFDNYGIIRDVVQNHILQIISLVGIETPKSTHFEDVREEKVKFLRCVKEADLETTVVGQYAGYLEEDGVGPGSRSPTMVTTVLNIDNERWRGVPFIIRAGKGLNERKCEVRIQFHESGQSLLGISRHDELIMCVGPTEAIYMRIVVKRPGMDGEYVETDLNMTYKDRFEDYGVSGPYEILILQAAEGNQTHFVRSDELREAWRIFTPLLKALEEQDVVPLAYERGSRGPAESDQLMRDSGFVYSGEYRWPLS